MSIQGCQLAPSSDRSHKAAIDRRSSAIVSVERTCAAGASADLAAGHLRASGKWKMPLSSIVTCISSALPSLSKLRARSRQPHPARPGSRSLGPAARRQSRRWTYEEVTAGKHFVDVGADDGDRWFVDHLAGRVPPSGDGMESRIWRPVSVVAHVTSSPVSDESSARTRLLRTAVP